jgi:hypothetical protein
LLDLISAACSCLVSLFGYNQGLEAVRKKPIRYFEMFLKLGDLNDTIKKYIIQLFYQCSNNLKDPFDDIIKAATSYADKTETIPFS